MKIVSIPLQTRTAWLKTITQYVRHPVMLTSLAIVLIVPLGLLIVRLLGFSPTTQLFTALETIGANLYWVPPLAGWLKEKFSDLPNRPQ